MGNEQQQSTLIPKLINSYLQVSQAFRFLFFLVGFSLGITVSLYMKSFSFSLQAIIFSPSQSPSSISLKLIPPIVPTPPPLVVNTPPPPPPAPLPPPTLPPLVNVGLVGSTIGTSLLHDMDDEELFRRAASVSRIQGLPERVSKVAFMFLTKGPMPLGHLWEKFFEGHDGLYTIYLHTHPSYNDSVPQSSVFHGRRIPSKPVEWGTPSMIDAERRLLANALLEISNERFVLLSETCIPLFNFTTIYAYLLNANQSFIGSYDDPRKVGRGRYNPKMFPTIALSNWRKGSQWLEVSREIATEIVSDTKYYPVFQQHCSPPCYMDEHYIPTLVNILRAEQNSNRSITWVDWSKSGPHPGKFGKQAISSEFLDQVRFGTNCSYNGNTTSICFLFARKFLPNTLQPLLKLAPALLHFNA